MEDFLTGFPLQHTPKTKSTICIATLTGFEPATVGFEVQRAIQLRHKVLYKTIACEYNNLPEVGFEPTHPKITELKSAALDHSAIQARDLRYSRAHAPDFAYIGIMFDCSHAVSTKSINRFSAGLEPATYRLTADRSAN